MKKQYAYIQSVTNSGKRTSARGQYIQLVTEDSKVYFFTLSDMKKAKERANKNPEDVYSVEFTEPEPKVIVKGVIKYVEVAKPSKPSIFSRLASFRWGRNKK